MAVAAAMHKQIISIHGRAETGISHPFLCQDAAGQSYFVKRGNVSWNKLVLEFVLSNLALKYGIPTAAFELVEIPKLLAQQTLTKDRAGFDPGIAFASKRIPFGEDLGESHVRHIPDDLKIAVICFDWWTSNSGRNLTKIGGSPNLIWDPMMHTVMAIDHDQTLDPDFETSEFFQTHVFRNVRPFMEREVVRKLRLKFESAVKDLPEIWSKLPQQWLEDEAGSRRATLDLAEVETALLNPKQLIEGILPI